MSMGSISKAYVIAIHSKDHDPPDYIESSPHTILMVIFRGDGGRIWYEPHYLDKSIKPIGGIAVTVPNGPEDPNQLLDALIAFAPKFFENCPSLKVVKNKLANKKRLDFDLGKDDIPESWDELRKESRSAIEQGIKADNGVLGIYSTKFEKTII
ncbi:hypothetical protein NMSP_1230 [Candidatus Nitrosomarinus catalina]|uniref:Uncharacterized protein n=2 Tax=Candidatus Nitrosomarinus catalinensis TaxID=1898749 RepID=A0A2Z2HM86_9ARCH|nr:hypothetical protein NMSP_1230 [Candidatus Nitrosomarinus catalina]